MKRWIILIFAGILVGGTAFLNIWSIFQKPLLAHFPGSTPSQIVLVYSLTLLAMGLSAPFAGRLMDKFGPRVVLIAGAVMWTVGCYLNSLVTELWQMYITYCLIMGIGDGFLYTNCVVNTVKWFPDRRALASGVIVTFGALAPMVWTPLAMHFMGSVESVMEIFPYFALIFVFTMIVLAFFVVPPPDGYVPAGWDPSKSKSTAGRLTVPDRNTWDMVRDPAFYVVVLSFMFGVGTGAMMVGHSAAIGINQIGMTAAVAAQTVTVFALCNAIGRIVLGYCSDTFGRYITQGCIFVVYIIGANILNIAATTPVFMIGCGCIAFGWGGTWAAYPAITSEFWGSKNLGANYGIVFIGASIGGYVYPKLAAMAVESTGTYTMAYVAAMAFAVLGIIMVAWLSRRAKQRFSLLAASS